MVCTIEIKTKRQIKKFENVRNFVWHYCQPKLIFKGQRAAILGSTQLMSSEYSEYSIRNRNLRVHYLYFCVRYGIARPN